MSERHLMRWTEGGSEHAALADAVRALRQQSGSAHDVEALAARLSAELAAPTSAASARGAQSAMSLVRLRMPWLAAAGIGLVLSTLALVSWRENAASRGVPPIAPQVSAPALAPHASLAPSAPGLEPPTEVPAPAAPDPEHERVPASADAHSRRASRAQAHAHAQRAHEAAPNLRPSPNDPEAELKLLARAQAALDAHPASALMLAAQHARDYPRGVFSEEREVLALEAELKLHQGERALVRAQRFIEQHPRSAHARRVRALLDASHEPAPDIDDTEAPLR